MRWYPILLEFSKILTKCDKKNTIFAWIKISGGIYLIFKVARYRRNQSKTNHSGHMIWKSFSIYRHCIKIVEFKKFLDHHNNLWKKRKRKKEKIRKGNIPRLRHLYEHRTEFFLYCLKFSCWLTFIKNIQTNFSNMYTSP